MEDDELRKLVGRVFAGRYRLDDYVARGGFGAVYRGTDERLKKTVAVKVGISYRNFLREGLLLAQLEHDHIVRPLDFGEEYDRAFLVMDYLQGETLKEVFSRGGRQLPELLLRQLVEEIGDALAYAHERSLVHRDLKPRNIMHVVKSGGRRKFMLLDFGIAAKVDAEGTLRNHTSSGAGTVEYMAPELLKEKPTPTPHTYVYSFGVILYEMLTGRVPFPLPDSSVIGLANCLRDVVTLPPPSFAEAAPQRRISPRIEALVFRCLAKDPQRRPGSIRDVRDEFLAPEPAVTRPASPASAPLPTGVVLNSQVEILELVDLSSQSPAWRSALQGVAAYLGGFRRLLPPAPFARGRSPAGRSGAAASPVADARSVESLPAEAPPPEPPTESTYSRSLMIEMPDEPAERDASSGDPHLTPFPEFSIADASRPAFPQSPQPSRWEAAMHSALSLLGDVRRHWLAEHSPPIPAVPETSQPELTQPSVKERPRASEEQPRWLRPARLRQWAASGLAGALTGLAGALCLVLCIAGFRGGQRSGDALQSSASGPTAVPAMPAAPADTRASRFVRRSDRRSDAYADSVRLNTVPADPAPLTPLRPPVLPLSEPPEPSFTPPDFTPPVVPQKPVEPPLPFDFATRARSTAEAQAAQQAWARYLGREVVATNSIGMKLVLLPPGEYRMGAAGGAPDEAPPHVVRFSRPIYVGRTEVTQKEWVAVMGTTPWSGNSNIRVGDRYPAANISWLDAVQFCAELSRGEKQDYSLLTEAEWEYACRAGTTTHYSFGYDVELLPRYAWGASLPHAYEVGLLLPNPFGLHDMHGNVWEWCYDWYDPKYYVPDREPASAA